MIRSAGSSSDPFPEPDSEHCLNIRILILTPSFWYFYRVGLHNEVPSVRRKKEIVDSAVKRIQGMQGLAGEVSLLSEQLPVRNLIFRP